MEGGVALDGFGLVATSERKAACTAGSTCAPTACMKI